MAVLFGDMALTEFAFCNINSLASLIANLILQPGCKPRTSLISLGMVTCPFLDKVECMIFNLNIKDYFISAPH